MSLQIKANAAGKFWTHVEVEHTQGSHFTSLYPANTGGGGSWVRGKRVWFGGGERRKPILGFLLKLFWGKCPAGMTCCPKEARISSNHQVHAMKDGERERTPTLQQVGVPQQTNEQNSLLCLVIGSGIASTGKWWWLSDQQTIKWLARTSRPDKGC